jgi:hypothetical protein
MDKRKRQKGKTLRLWKRRVLSLAMAMALSMSMLPTTAYAETGTGAPENGDTGSQECICTSKCTEETVNNSCTVCSDDWSSCGFEETSSDSSDDTVALNDENSQSSNSENPDSQETLCDHNNDKSDCSICAVQALIDALPDAEDINAENAQDVTEQIIAIDEAIEALDEADAGKLTEDKLENAKSAISALSGNSDIMMVSEGEEEEDSEDTSLKIGTGVIDVADGFVVFYEDKYTVGDNEYSYDYSNPITLTGSYDEEDVTTTLVEFKDSINATLILDNLNINKLNAGIDIGTSNVTCLLKGESNITSGYSIKTPEGSTLTIKDYEGDEETGILNALAIGVEYVQPLGTINIESGIINTTGRIGHNEDDYRISWTETDAINIYGGRVTVGSRIAAGYVNIQGGIVTASGGIRPGKAFSTGENGNALINGAVDTYFVSSYDKTTWSCIIAESTVLYKVYGNVVLTEDFTVEDELQITEGATLTVPAGVTLTNNDSISVSGTLDVSEGTYTGSGLLSVNEGGILKGVNASEIPNDPVLNVSNIGKLKIYSDHYVRNDNSYYYNGTLTLTTNGNTSVLWLLDISSADDTVENIKLENANISGLSYFRIYKDLTLETVGENTIYGPATLSENVTLTIKGEDAGKDRLNLKYSGKPAVISGSSSTSKLVVENCTLNVENTFDSPYGGYWDSDNGSNHMAIKNINSIDISNSVVSTKAQYATDISSVGTISLKDSVLKVDGEQVNNEADIPTNVSTGNWTGVVYDGGDVSIYNSSGFAVPKLPTDITIDAGSVVYIDKVLDINGKTITNNGLVQIITDGKIENTSGTAGTIQNNGDIIYEADKLTDAIGENINIEGNKPNGAALIDGYLEVVSGADSVEHSTDADTNTEVLKITGSTYLRGYPSSGKTGDVIEISGGTADEPIVVTLENIDIEGEANKNAISIADGSYVKLILKGTNTVNAGAYGCAGINVPENAALIITCEYADTDANHVCDESCGSLTVTAGHSSNGDYKYQDSAAIGAVQGEKAGSIYIEGGNIDATGGWRQYAWAYNTRWGAIGSDEYNCVAAIGSAALQPDSEAGTEGCTLVCISGGNITAYGGSNAEDSINASTVEITGGTVTTKTINATTFSTGEEGNAVVFATGISDVSSEDNWNGIIFGADSDDSTAGQVYGTAYTLVSDLTIPAGDTLTIPEGVTLIIPEGRTLTNNGTIIAEGTLYADGTVLNSDSGLIIYKASPSLSSNSVFKNDGTIKVDVADVSLEEAGIVGSGAVMYKITEGTMEDDCSISISCDDEGKYDDGYAVAGAELTIAAQYPYGNSVASWKVNDEVQTDDEKNNITSDQLTLTMPARVTTIVFDTYEIKHEDEWSLFDNSTKNSVLNNVKTILNAKALTLPYEDNYYSKYYSDDYAYLKKTETRNAYYSYSNYIGYNSNVIGILCVGDYDCDATDESGEALDRQGGKLTIKAPGSTGNNDDYMYGMGYGSVSSTYDGTEKAATLEADENFKSYYKVVTGRTNIPTNDDITYSKYDSTEGKYVDISSAPKDAGQYRATITIKYYVDSNGNVVEPDSDETASAYTEKVYTAYTEYTITQKEITVKADEISKTYGTTDPELTYTVVDDPEVEDDGLADCDKENYTALFNGALSRESGDDVGEYIILQGELELKDDSNYKLAGFTESTFTITQAEVDVPEIQPKVYTGDTLTADIDESSLYDITNDGGKDAGVYPVILTLNDSANYKWNSETAEGATINLDFEITQADPELKVDTSIEKTYDDDVFALNVSRKGEGELKFESENEDVLTVDENGNVTITGAGDAVIKVSLAETNNYTSASAEISVKVARKNGNLVVTGQTYEKTYGDKDFSIGYTLTEGDAALVTYNSDNTDVAAVDTKGNVTIKGQGTAVITIKSEASANYAADETTVTVKVAQASLDSAKVKLTLPDDGYIYDGNEKKPEIQSVTTADGLVLTADDYTVGYKTNVEAGTAKAVVTAVKDGNYTGSAEAGFTISPKEITVTANDQTKKYSEEDPELTYKADGLAGSDKLSGALTRETGEKVGEYTINQGTLKGGNNYNLTFETGTLTITKNPGATIDETVTDEDGTKTTTKTDDSDKVVETIVEKTDGTKTVTEISSDGSSVVTKTDADGNVTEKIETDKDGNVTKTENKADGSRVVTETATDGSKTVTENKADGSSVITKTDADGNVTEKIETDKDGNVTKTENKADGSRVVTETATDGSKIVTENKADGSSVVTKTDASGNLTEKTEVTKDTTTVTKVDENGTTVTATKTDGSSESITVYDSTGALVSNTVTKKTSDGTVIEETVKQPEESYTKTVIADDGSKTVTAIAGTKTETTEYDKDGKVTKTTVIDLDDETNENVTTTTENMSDGSTVVTKTAGNTVLTTTTSADGKTVTTALEVDGKKVSEKTEDANTNTTTEKTYTAGELVQEVITTSDETTEKVYTNGELTKETVTTVDGKTVTAYGETTTVTKYDADGNKTEESVTAADGTKTTVEYKPNDTTVTTVESTDGVKSVTIDTKAGSTTTDTYPDGKIVVTMKTTEKTTTMVKNTDGSSTITEENTDGTKTVTESSSDGSSVVTKTDADGNVTEKTETDKDGNVTKTENKADGGKVVTETATDGSKIVTENKADGSSVVTKTDADGKVTEKTEAAADGSKTVTENKTDGSSVVTKTDVDGNVMEKTETAIDGSKTVTENKADGSSVVTKIDASGNMTEKTEVTADTTTVTKVDENGTTVTATKTDGSSESVTVYDSTGALVSNTVTKKTSDGTVIEETVKQPEESYTKTVIADDGSKTVTAIAGTKTETTEYDKDGKVTKTIVTDLDDETNENVTTTTENMSDGSTVVTKTAGNTVLTTTTSADGKTVTTILEVGGKKVSEKTEDANTNTTTEKTYTAGELIQEVITTPDETTEKVYTNGELTKETVTTTNETAEKVYTNGELIQETVTTADGKTVTTYGETTTVTKYDAKGNVTEKTETDEDGNVTRTENKADASTVVTKTDNNGNVTYRRTTYEDGSYVQDGFNPELIEGDKSVYKEEAMAFRSNDEFINFKSVEVDGETVSPENYTAVSGSILITFTNEYLATLEEGEHTISILSTNGSADGTFTIPESDGEEEEPPVEEPKEEEPVIEEPKKEEPVVEEPKEENPPAEEPKKEEPVVEEPKKESPSTETGTKEGSVDVAAAPADVTTSTAAPATVTPATTEAVDTKAPKTGDESKALVAVLLLLLSEIGIALSVMFRKRRR